MDHVFLLIVKCTPEKAVSFFDAEDTEGFPEFQTWCTSSTRTAPAEESHVWDGSLIWGNGSEGDVWKLLKHQLEADFISQSFAFCSGRTLIHKL